MELRIIRSSFFAVIAIVVGAIVLLGYFIELEFLTSLRVQLLQWAAMLAAVVLLVGVVNLARVHWRKFSTQQVGGSYSLVLLISLGGTFLISIAGLWLNQTNLLTWMFKYIQTPIESSLMAVLAIVLVFSVARLLNRRLNVFSIIFIGTVMFVLIGTASLPGIELGILREIRAWLVQVFAAAGARGILLGVALGTIATGLRVLIGVDRPYGG